MLNTIFTVIILVIRLPRAHLIGVNTLNDNSGAGLPVVNLSVPIYYYVTLGKLLPSPSAFSLAKYK